MPIERWAVISRNGEAEWCGRRKHQVVSHRGSLYLLGGYTSGSVLGAGGGPNANLHDVWKSTDGAAWVRLLEHAPWSGRDGHAALTHNGAMYLMGGTQDIRSNFSDVWRSVNGRDWVQVCRQAPWQGRWQHAALSYQGFIFVVGGWRHPGCLSDVWRSTDGVRWTKTCSHAPWGGRMFHSMVEANGAMYLLGGSNGSEKLNDAWVSTDGRDWNLVTHDCQWSPRSGHASVCFDNSLYVIGGDGSNGKLKDVWRSDDGAHWARTEEDVRVPRQGHAAVCHQGRVLVLGGVTEGTVFLNDCLAGLSAAQISTGALREHGLRLPTGGVSAAATPSEDRAGALRSVFPTAGAAAAVTGAATTPAAATNGGALFLGGAPLQRSGVGAGGEGRELWRGASGVMEGGSGGGGSSGGGALSRRLSSRGFRHQSVEDDLWGWFGDDRPPSETALHAMPRGDGNGMEVTGGGWKGESTEVTVSTLALTDRLAKLSAGRVLLDRVRTDTRSLAAVVSSAARSAFAGRASVAGSSGQLDAADAMTTTPSAAAAAAQAATQAMVAAAAVESEEAPISGATAPRTVHFTSGSPSTAGQSPGRPPPDGHGAVAPNPAREEAPADATVSEAEIEAGGDGNDAPRDGSGGAGATAGEIAVAASSTATATATSAAATPPGVGGAPRAALRQRVVEAKAEIRGLQTEIRRLVREAGVGDEGRREGARGLVGPLVARRAALAAAARADAERMATRLQEISEAQKSNHSKVDAAMREVERRARTAGGRVWALIRGNSRQHPDDGGGGGGDEDDSGGDHGVAAGGLFPSERVGDGGAAAAGNGRSNAGAATAAPEWVMSRLELMRMRRRGSFLNGDELGPVRTPATGVLRTPGGGAASATTAAAGGVADGGRGSEMVTAESFGNLAALASAEGNEERRETDEAVSGLRDAMMRHSAALSRLAGWMLQTAVPPAIGDGGGSDGTIRLGGAEVGAIGGMGMQGAGGSGLASMPPPPPPVNSGLDSTRGLLSGNSAAESGIGAEEGEEEEEEEEEEGVRAMLELSRESDVLEGMVKRERFRAHRAADEEIHRTPELYREACALGNALILKGHDYLSQVLADAGRDSAEASIMAEEASAWAATVRELVDEEGLAEKGRELKARVQELRDSVLDWEESIVDCRGALDKKRLRGGNMDELKADLAAAEKGARRARRAGRHAAASAAKLAHGLSPEIALDLPEALNPLIGRQQVVQDVSIAGINLPLRRLKEYESLRAMEDEGSTGGGQGRHRIFLAEYDDETVVLKGYALVNALQRHSLERELHILDRVRHGAIIRAGAIVEDDGAADNPIPMLYIEFPYCAQGNLRQWLKAQPRQPWELQEAFRQVMCAVMHLHDVGIIHKDIKPGNILVHADGRFLLADFDVSKDTLGANAGRLAGSSGAVLAERDGGGGGGGGFETGDGASLAPRTRRMEAETTRTNATGTSGFMAPEVEGGTPSSLASDMYSMGAVLFHMHFPDHPTGPLPITEGAPGNAAGGGGGIGSVPRGADAPTAGLLKALLAVDPSRRPRASDALQADYFRVSHVSRLQEDGALLEQTRKLEAVRALFRNVREEAKASGPLKWTVKRDSRYLVPTVLRLIKTDAAGSSLRRALKITFEGEAGVDEGGILSEMYTLLFDAMMMPRFGLFEDCESPPLPSPLTAATTTTPTTTTASSPPGRVRRASKDPAEKAFSSRFSGALPGSNAAAADTSSDGGGDGDRFSAYLGPIPGGIDGAPGEGQESEGGDDTEEDDGEEEDEDEGLASGGEGGQGKGLSKMLPMARPGGYSDAQLGRYRTIGRAMVKCLLEGRRIGSRLAPSVFKYITGTGTTLRDLQDFDPQTFESLKWMLANTGMREMGFDFEDVGQPDKGPVTDGNKADYVSAKARLILVESRKPALEALKGGFAAALRDLSPGAAPFMELLSHADWRVLLCGQEHVSGPQVVAVLTWYGFPDRSEVPGWIKALLLSLPEDALRRFLIFVCGTPSLPAPSAGKVEITVRCQPRSAALPAAHTCFFQLDVPDYDRESVLRHKLLQAVNNTASFDVV